VVYQSVEQHCDLYQDRDALIQEAGLSSLARVDSHPLTKIIQDVTSWCVDDAQCVNSNGFEVCRTTSVRVL